MFHPWTFSDAHEGTDKRHGRESLADAIRHSEFGGGLQRHEKWQLETRPCFNMENADLEALGQAASEGARQAA